MKKEISFQEIVAKDGFKLMKQGETVFVQFSSGEIQTWVAPLSGYFEVEDLKKIGRREVCFINQIVFGYKFAERGGTPYKRRLEASLWSALGNSL